MSHKQKHVGPTSSRVSPPLGALPSQPDSPEVQLPPPEPDLPPIQAVPMTDGTPAACMQKNAKEFLAGNTPGVMAQYAPGLFSTEQKRNSRQPAPDDPEAVKELVRLREEEPYGWLPPSRPARQFPRRGSPWQNVPFCGYHIRLLQVNLKFSNYFPITC